ncbi:(d)CMP kinase [Canibacter zhoujuaniae]|uniref:(d)CMP kinase n=1 Tax=Canibacter zhoujuaniae TaxID=2708343 RepID=UPI001AB04AAA|nr:(d)CMP kinase [Canibacter zhoujuaniae]
MTCEKPIIVAIDGPAGSGKSSVARAVAEKLGYGFLDTGAAYRALTWLLLQQGALAGRANLAADALAVLKNWQLELPLAADGEIRLNGQNIAAQIRDPKTTEAIKHVSAIAAVRDELNRWFRKYVSVSGLPGVVIEGRDITTVVMPDAKVRIILTASPEVRAVRRQKQLPQMTFAQVLEDLRVRDEADLKVVNFIDPAPGVKLIDTSELDFAGSVAAVVEYAQERAGKLG